MGTLKIRTGAIYSDLILSDKRKYFWQWDTGCKIELIGLPTVDELHYSNFTLEQPYTLKVYEEGDKRLCNIPDEILQNAGEFEAYAYIIESDGNRTYLAKKFTVRERPKPTDYIYTETEKYTVAEAVADALNEAKESGDFRGEKGNDGLSAYEVAVKNGFEGTEEEWLESLNGGVPPNVLTVKTYLKDEEGVI